VGAESIHEALEFAHHAEQLGATAVMAIPPVATSLSGTKTADYFAAIASRISIPLIVQDASSYVGAAIDLGVYLRLLERFGPDKIYFKPEASPLGPNLSKLRDASGSAARIFEGSGGINLVDCYRRGIVGTMPGTDLLDGIVALWRALNSGDEDRVYQLSLPICALTAMQLQAGLDGFLAIEKYLMHKRGIFPNTLQVQPCGWQLDPETVSEVDRLFNRLQRTLALER
jgi:4-hydroxy-tetrahydrodipicolinate synthase